MGTLADEAAPQLLAGEVGSGKVQLQVKHADSHETKPRPVFKD